MVPGFPACSVAPPELNRLRASPGEKPVLGFWDEDVRSLVAMDRSGVGMPPTDPDRRLVADKLASSVDRMISMFSDNAAT